MFFVLSGFLITYLLMTEIQKTGTVSVRMFYIRRILRIWPIYYLLLFLGLVVLPLIVQVAGYQGQFLPQASSPLQVILYIIMLPNAAAFFGALIPGISQLWTIGIEEQFYLLWPALTKLFAKRILTAIIGVIVVKIVLNLFLNQIMDDNNYPLIFRALLGFLNNLSFEYMAVGALGAYLLFHKHRLLNLIFHPVVEKLTLLFMVCNITVIAS